MQPTPTRGRRAHRLTGGGPGRTGRAHARSQRPRGILDGRDPDARRDPRGAAGWGPRLPAGEEGTGLLLPSGTLSGAASRAALPWDSAGSRGGTGRRAATASPASLKRTWLWGTLRLADLRASHEVKSQGERQGQAWGPAPLAPPPAQPQSSGPSRSLPVLPQGLHPRELNSVCFGKVGPWPPRSLGPGAVTATGARPLRGPGPGGGAGGPRGAGDSRRPRCPGPPAPTGRGGRGSGSSASWSSSCRRPRCRRPRGSRPRCPSRCPRHLGTRRGSGGRPRPADPKRSVPARGLPCRVTPRVCRGWKVSLARSRPCWGTVGLGCRAAAAPSAPPWGPGPPRLGGPWHACATRGAGLTGVLEVRVLAVVGAAQPVGRDLQLHDLLADGHVGLGDVHLHLGVVDLVGQAVAHHLGEVPGGRRAGPG